MERTVCSCCVLTHKKKVQEEAMAKLAELPLQGKTEIISQDHVYGVSSVNASALYNLSGYVVCNAQMCTTSDPCKQCLVGVNDNIQ